MGLQKLKWQESSLEAEVWGVDRLHFETHLTYEFLNEHSNEFNLIHMCFITGGCEWFLIMLDDIQVCLKPGRLFICKCAPYGKQMIDRGPEAVTIFFEPTLQQMSNQ